jgi:hypothetical protein
MSTQRYSVTPHPIEYRVMLLAVAMLLGCGTPPSQSSQPQELPIPSDLQPHIERALALGQEIYEHDWASARGTDVLVERLGTLEGKGLGGYLSVRAGDDEGNPTGACYVLFFTNETPQRIAYVVRLWSEGGQTLTELDEFKPPKDATEGELVLISARQVALKALKERTQRLNPVVVPADWFDDPGVLVYLIAATTRPNCAVLGRHYRVFVSEDGQTVQKLEPLSRAIIEIEFSEDAEALYVSHNITDWPLETHVFASLLYDKPIYVGTERGVWRVTAERIALISERRPGQPDAGDSR